MWYIPEQTAPIVKAQTRKDDSFCSNGFQSIAGFNNKNAMKDEIVIYQSDKPSSRINVRLDNDTVWLNRQQISTLFDRDVKTIGKHINNVFAEAELDKNSTVANFATVQNEGGRQVEHYNPC